MDEVAKFFGLDLQTIAMMAGFVYIIVEAMKTKFAKVFMGGWRTDILAMLLSAGMAYKIYYPDVWAMILSGIMCWIGPAMLHKKTSGK